MAEYTQEELNRIIEQNEQLSKQVEQLTRETNQLRQELEEFREGYKTLSRTVADTFKRLGTWARDKMDFVHELMNEDITQAKAFMSVFKDNFLDLTDRVSQTTKNMFDKVTTFIKEDPPVPFHKVLDFALKQYQAEIDAHFLEIDTKTLGAMEKVTLLIALQKGKIQDERAEWVSTLKHEGWKLAEKLGFHQERNKELGNKLLESTKLFGEAIKGIGEVCKEIPQPAVNWIKTNLIDTIPKSVEKIQHAVETSKDYVKKAFTLSVPEFFKAAKEGVERAIAEKEGYKMMANGEMVAPTLGEVVKNKLTEPFAPLVEKLKNITQKSSVIIKKEGAYQSLGESTKGLSQRTSMMNLEYVPGSIPVTEPTKEKMDLVTAKAEKLDNTLTKATETIHFGGHLSEGTLSQINSEMQDLNTTIDDTVGKEVAKQLSVEVQKEDIALTIKNDMSLQPIGGLSSNESISMEDRSIICNHAIEGMDLGKTANMGARQDAEFYLSDKGECYMMQTITIPTGKSIEVLYAVDLENKTVTEPVRINEQKEIGGESRTVFDKATAFLAVSAINNGIAGKILAAMPMVKECIEKTIQATKDIADPVKETDKVAEAPIK